MQGIRNLWKTIINWVNDNWQDFRKIWITYKWFRFYIIWFIAGIILINVFRRVLGMSILPPAWIWSWWATQSLLIVSIDIILCVVWTLGVFLGLWRLIVEIIRKTKEKFGY